MHPGRALNYSKRNTHRSLVNMFVLTYSAWKKSILQTMPWKGGGVSTLSPKMKVTLKPSPAIPSTVTGLHFPPSPLLPAPARSHTSNASRSFLQDATCSSTRGSSSTRRRAAVSATSPTNTGSPLFTSSSEAAFAPPSTLAAASHDCAAHAHFSLRLGPTCRCATCSYCACAAQTSAVSASQL